MKKAVKYCLGAIILIVVCCVMVVMIDKDTESNGDSKKPDKEAKKVVTEAIQKLKDYNEPKMVYMAEASSTNSYTCVETSNGNYLYTEMPYEGSETYYDEDEEDGTEVSDAEYILYDWVNKDGNAYILNSTYNEEEEDSKLWIKMPEGYGEMAWSKSNLYADLLYDAKTIQKSDKESLNFGGESLEECDMYVCDVTEDKIKKVMELDTLTLTELSLKDTENHKDDEKYKDVKEFIEENKEGYERTSAWAKGKAYFGIKDGMVKYVRLETGGAGTSYFVERVILDQTPENVREEQDFESDCIAYYNLIIDYLDYINEANTDTEDVNDAESVDEEDSTELLDGADIHVSSDGTTLDEVETDETDNTNNTTDENTQESDTEEKTEGDTEADTTEEKTTESK